MLKEIQDGSRKVTCDETRNAKRSSAIGLGVPLLQAGNMPEHNQSKPIFAHPKFSLSYLVMYSKVTGSSTVSLWD